MLGFDPLVLSGVLTIPEPEEQPSDRDAADSPESGDLISHAGAQDADQDESEFIDAEN